MTGFFLYMQNVLVWLPPFIVPLIVEAGGNTRWGFLCLLIFQVLGLGCMIMTARWEEVLEESDKKVLDHEHELYGDKGMPEAIKQEDAVENGV